MVNTFNTTDYSGYVGMGPKIGYPNTWMVNTMLILKDLNVSKSRLNLCNHPQ